MVVAAVLLGAGDLDDAVRLLRHVPGLVQASDEMLRRLALWLRELYPQTAGDWLNPHLPGRLVEHYAAHQLTANAPLLAVLATVAVGDRAVRALTVLAHAARHTPTATQAVARLVACDPPRLLPAAIRAARAGAGPIDHALADAVTTTALTAADLDAIDRLIPYPTQALAHTAIAVARQRLAHVDTDEHRAYHLTNLGVRLAELGRWEEALAATEKAVSIRRRLAARWPQAFKQDLATAEANLRRLRAALGLNPDDSGKASSLTKT